MKLRIPKLRRDKKDGRLVLAYTADQHLSVEAEACHSLWILGRQVLDTARTFTLNKADPEFKRRLDTLFQAMTYRHNRLYQAFKKERQVRQALEKRSAFLEALLSVNAIANGQMIEASLRSEKLSPVAAENEVLKDLLKDAELELIRYKNLYRDSILRSVED